MANDEQHLKLGKGAGFVKSRLRRLPQFNDSWEADIQPIRDEQGVEFWLGMVVEQEHGAVLSIRSLDHAPTVNDLATLLAHAMHRPLTENRHQRPATILLRQHPQWDELLRLLEELRIDVVLTDRLPAWTDAVDGFAVAWERQMRKLVAKVQVQRQAST